MIKEGNANILVPTEGKLLRISKYPTHFSAKQIHHFIQQSRLSEEYKPITELVEMTREQLFAISTKIQEHRLESRKHKSIDFDQTHSLSLIDYSIFFSLTKLPIRIHTLPMDIRHIAIELKPKCGFIPTSLHIKNIAKFSTCRYCMHQQYKKHLDSAFTVSDYCPLDLYSESPPRIKSALSALCKVSGNNLRIHVNGMIVPIDVGIECFTGYFGVDLVELVAEILSRERVLNELKKLQMLDTHDIEHIYYLYQSSVQAGTSENEESEESLLIQSYIESMTYKDCSVMISLGDANSSLISPSSTCVIKLADTEIAYKITVLDLDPKEKKKIPAYFQLDKSITMHYSNLNINKKCI